MIIALAGRRIDAPDASTPRFPLERADVVAERIGKEFARLHAGILVCSAACGADLIALRVARGRGMRRRIVLPFDAAIFREKSVTDRPGSAKWDWGRLFDELYGEARAGGELVVVDHGGGGNDDAYKNANQRIIEEAEALRASSGAPAAGAISAMIVWEGGPRGEGDLTMEFAERARAGGFEVVPVLTN